MTAGGTSYSDRFRELIRSLTGISLPQSKVVMIEQRLRKRVLAFGLSDMEAYLGQLLEGQGMEEELRIVIDLITTNTTSFFRESDHFDFLVNEALPKRLAQAKGARKPRFKLWSAAASEGAEAYTSAMVLAEAQRRGAMFDFAVLATDISQRMLERGAEAVYGADQLSTVPPDLVKRYFMSSRHPSVAGKVRVVPELRRHVRFRHLNLMDETYPVDRDVDLIFLRNVLIYFDGPDQERVVARLASHVAPGGYLVVGHAESMVVRMDGLKQVRPTIFQKV
ncbi:chemotaxis protein CheR [Gemmobacter straminiformis]|uniref:Chemotaxis protein methyltransferase n=2 Tax=Paragemmobacter straminiformis TaxID=2045119 RepID=A0A842I3X2_9RHOB|nr:chemotaxis protein CheR [Gemmobacter straminiformis]